MIYLQVIHGPDSGKRASFYQDLIRLGSDPDNDFVLRDPLVEPFHAMLTCDADTGSYSYSFMPQLRPEGQKTQRSESQATTLLAQNAQIYLGKSVIQCCSAQHRTELVCLDEQSMAWTEHRSWPKEQAMQSRLLDFALRLSEDSLMPHLLQRIAEVFWAETPDIAAISIWQYNENFRDLERILDYPETTSLHRQAASPAGLMQSLKAGQIASHPCGNGSQIHLPILSEEGPVGLIALTTHTVVPPELTGQLEPWLRLARPSLVRAFNNIDLSHVFDSFIRATISVLDARDPTMTGHSMRVSLYAMMTAQAIHESKIAPFEHTCFNRSKLDELRYAALLHDIGKVSVPDNIVQKYTKLMPRDLGHLLTRIELFEAHYELLCRDEQRASLEMPPFERFREAVRAVSNSVQPANAAQLLDFEWMRRLRLPTRPGLRLLSDEEYENLTLPFGTLNAQERASMERHALVSWQYLSKIAWPQRWANIPTFVLQHHEKLNGSGYPLGITAEYIFLQSRIITVCDIFDALTCGDRPYTVPRSHEEAALILQKEVEKGALDPDIVGIFVRQVIPRIVDPDRLSSSVLPILSEA